MTHVNPRLRMMRGRFIALIAASAMTLGLIAASAVPARAEVDDKDIFKLLLGVAAVAILANELGNKKDDDRDHPVVVTPKPPKGQYGRIPAACSLQVQGLRNDRVGYSDSCLRSYGFRNLPQHCAVSARIYGRADRLYPASCLKQAGFRLGR